MDWYSNKTKNKYDKQAKRLLKKKNVKKPKNTFELSVVKQPKLYIQKYAQELFENATASEIKLYESLELAHIEFEFQKPIKCKEKSYIVDFLITCNKCYVIVEVDGGYHFNKKQRIKDRIRERNISKEIGAKFLRFTNDDVENNIDFVIQIILAHITKYLGVKSKLKIA